MTATPACALPRAAHDDGRRNIWLLAGGQAMQLSTNATLIAVSGLAGLALADDKSLATLPVSFWVVGGMLATLPASFHMKRVGRRRGFIHGALVGIAGALLSAAAIPLQSFWLLCFGALLFGAQNAVGQYFRFAAADSAAPGFRSTAISLVLAGGLLGGVLGPGISRFALDLFEPRFTGAFLALVVFALATIVLMRCARIPNPMAEEAVATGRPIAEIAAQPKFIVAALAGAVGYGVMYFLMTSAPIAMDSCGYPYGDAAFVISWHVVAMFAPSFLAGPLAKRFGVLNLMLAGALINVLSIGIALSGVQVAHFWWSLALLGVGWNFLYIGGTTLLTETYRPEERAKAQGANDFLVFAMMAVSSFSSGVIVADAGWAAVNLSALPMITVLLAAIGWLALRERRPAAA